MKQRIAALLAAAAVTVSLLLTCAVPVTAAGYPLPEDVTVYSEAAILVSLAGDPAQDVVLYEKNGDTAYSPGTMLRYMVLGYALKRIEEKGLDVDTEGGAYSIALFNQYVAGTGVNPAGMGYGEEWSLRDLMTLSFIHTASDAVVVLAEAIDGDVPTFLAGMNALAAELGCTNSYFDKLSGLDTAQQRTSPRDMYRIVRYCLQFSMFEELTSPFIYTVHPLKGGNERRIAGNNELMQVSSVHYYSPIVHSRPGRSEKDGRACAAVARDSGYEYLVVTMGGPITNDAGEGNLHYKDVKALLRWAFKKFEYKTVLAKREILATIKVNHAWDIDHVNLIPADEVATVVRTDIDTDQIIRKVTVYEPEVDAPVEQGTVYGKVELFVNVDQKIGEVELVASQSLERSALQYTWDGILAFLGGALPYVLILLGVAVLLVILYIVYAINHNRKRRGRRSIRNNRRIFK
ncbi:MAG: D-alanyl-D-alanine carboxypeptidase [Clostridia bacterium]|nr:D-alanyl-D-alanine carboxypeptidase [Clostridia bacterium]